MTEYWRMLHEQRTICLRWEHEKFSAIRCFAFVAYV